jgi:hypothetical protein
LFFFGGSFGGQLWYAWAKTIAERDAWRIAAEAGLDLVVVNPAFVVGPSLSEVPTSTLAIVLGILRGQHLSINRSINLSINRSIYLSIYRSIYLSIDRSIYQSIDLSIYLSIDLSTYLSS